MPADTRDGCHRNRRPRYRERCRGHRSR